MATKEFIEEQSQYDYKIRAVETMPDHVHILVSVPPSETVVNVISRIKGYTSKILREEFSELKKRLPNLWTRSRFVASIGGVTLEALKQYVESQKGV